MQHRNLKIDDLLINRANDRHGELENETAAIAWLFSSRETHMKNLAKDLAEQGALYEPPLVAPEGNKFIVFDGNRRVTCLKLMSEPRRAPTSELQSFFADIRQKWQGEFPTEILCQVEIDRDRLDNILYRRHTGTQNGVGQSNWDDRMKSNFIARTGKASGFNVAEEVEAQLAEANLLPPRKKIPRSTMNRLLSAEPFRNRLGFSVKKRKFTFTHDPDVARAALARVANDLATGRLVLGDIWDVDGKRNYLDDLETEGVLPTAQHALSQATAASVVKGKTTKRSPASRVVPTQRTTLIPQNDFQISWPGRLQRHHQIWEELQFHLRLTEHPNAISVLFRVLLELSVQNYLDQCSVAHQKDEKLKNKILKVGTDLHSKNLIDNKQLGEVRKFQSSDQIISADTLNRYVHSPSFAPSSQHLTSLWDSMADFIVHCLKA